MSRICGRAPILRDLWEHVAAGHTVLLHGPVGIGKTTLLSAIRDRARAEGRPCGLAPQTRALGEVTRALGEAYPQIDSRGREQRWVRGHLRLAVEREPGVLLLDHLTDAGAALKGYLRSLRGSGLGVLMACDVEHARDRARLRALGLAYREIEAPPLHGRVMARLLTDRLASAPVLHPLYADDSAALLAAAAGRPGWLAAACARLADPRYWSEDGRIRLTLLAADAKIATAERLLRRG